MLLPLDACTRTSMDNLGSRLRRGLKLLLSKCLLLPSGMDRSVLNGGSASLTGLLLPAVLDSTAAGAQSASWLPSTWCWCLLSPAAAAQPAALSLLDDDGFLALLLPAKMRMNMPNHVSKGVVARSAHARTTAQTTHTPTSSFPTVPLCVSLTCS